MNTEDFVRLYWQIWTEGMRWGRDHPVHEVKERVYPTPDHSNVVSIAAHRSWIPRGGAA